MVGLALFGVACGAPPADGSGGIDGADGDLALAQATNCERPPAGSDDKAVEAYDRVNAYRNAAGLSCLKFSPEIAIAAAAHCDYYVSNSGSCVASPHREVASCSKFRAEKFSDRMKAAAYTGNPAYEAMTYVGQGAHAVDKWVDSVWHRIPILSPWVADGGYGSVKACDTMDFGWAPASTQAAPVTYPFAGQAKVPRSFDGATESPALPVPPKGWPSGYPIMVYASELQVSSHNLYDDQMNPVDHTFMAPSDATAMGILRNEVAMYAHAPLKKATTYRVVIEGQRKGEAVKLDWTFTTK
jgi:hypothetical protein